MRKIFCTNDDGVESPGLAVLADRLGPLGDVVVGAPDVDMSGTGTAILRHDVRGGVRIRRHTYESHPHVEAHSVTGTPAMTVVLAERGAFGAAPDVVVSGPNLGANVGHDVHHSGTVGAAAAASRRGIHGVAVSLGFEAADHHDGNLHWGTAADVAAAVVERLLERRHSDAVLLNLNVPNRPLEKLEGLVTVTPAETATMRFLGFDERRDPDGSRHLTPRFEREIRASPDTDVGALRAGFATISWFEVGLVRPKAVGIDSVASEVGELLGLAPVTRQAATGSYG